MKLMQRSMNLNNNDIFLYSLPLCQPSSSPITHKPSMVVISRVSLPVCQQLLFSLLFLARMCQETTNHPHSLSSVESAEAVQVDWRPITTKMTPVVVEHAIS